MSRFDGQAKHGLGGRIPPVGPVSKSATSVSMGAIATHRALVLLFMAVMLAAGMAGASGCKAGLSGGDRSADTAAQSTDAHSGRSDSAAASPAGGVLTGAVGERDSIFHRRPERRVVEFKVHRVQAPRGAFTQSEAIWRLVSGRLPSAATALHLSDNGFRAAIGLDAHRSPLAEEFRQIRDVRMAADQVVPDISRSIELELGSCAANEAVFYFDASGGLHGLDFVNAKARLKVTLEWRSVNPDELWLRVAPELEEPPGPMQWEMTPDGPQVAAQRRVRMFEDVIFETPIPPGGFLLLGPTAGVYDRPLLGRPFFVAAEAEKGVEEPVERESVYVISPVIRVLSGPGEPAERGGGAEGAIR